MIADWVVAAATVVGGFIAVVVWLIRLEGKANYTERAVEKLEVKHDALDNKIVDKLSEIEKSLAKIQGRMGIADKDDSRI